jgi:hypothetical protein
MIIIADYYIYHIGEITCKKNIAELNVHNGLLKVHAKFHSENSKPELIVDILEDSVCVFLDDNEFTLSEDGSYYTTFLKDKDRELVEEIYFNNKFLFT